MYLNELTVGRLIPRAKSRCSEGRVTETRVFMAQMIRQMKYGGKPVPDTVSAVLVLGELKSS